MKSISTTLFPLVMLLLVATQQSVAQQYSALDTEVEIIPAIQEKLYRNIGKIGEHTYSYTSKGAAVLGKKTDNLRFIIYKHDENMEVIESKEITAPINKVSFFWFPKATIRTKYIDVTLAYSDQETQTSTIRIIRFDSESFEEVSDTELLKLKSASRKSKNVSPSIDYIPCSNNRDEFGFQYYDDNTEEFNIFVVNSKNEIEFQKKYAPKKNFSNPTFSQLTTGEDYFSILEVRKSLIDFRVKTGSILHYDRSEKEIVNIPIEGAKKNIVLTSYLTEKLNDNTFIITGYYEAKRDADLDEAGYFSYTFDANKGNLLNESYKPFPIKELSEKELKKRAKKKNPAKLMNCNDLYARKLLINEDGTINMIGEDYHMRTVSKDNSSRIGYRHYYNDLFLVNIDSSGNIVSNFRFKKYFLSIEDSGKDGIFLLSNQTDYIRIVYMTRELELGLSKKDRTLCVAKIQKRDGSAQRELLVNFSLDYKSYFYYSNLAQETEFETDHFIVPMRTIGGAREAHITFK